MLGPDTLNLRNELQDKHVLFAYSGYVSERVLFALGEALRQKLTLDQTDKSITRKVFSVFVEQVQNVIRYSAEVEPDNASPPERLANGIVTVGNDDGKYFVQCGNPIEARDSGRLKERLEHISALDRTELKRYYRQKLKDDPEAASLGATVGLIEIARRATSPLEFDFIELNDDLTFFVLKAYI